MSGSGNWNWSAGSNGPIRCRFIRTGIRSNRAENIAIIGMRDHTLALREDVCQTSVHHKTAGIQSYDVFLGILRKCW